MKILVLGSGGREHALVWKLKRDGHEVTCAPGNAGISRIAECVALNPEDISGVAAYAGQSRLDLTIVGSEAPLVAGVSDELLRRGLPIFGPTRQAAQLEGSKAFAKQLMLECGIPTARFETFTDAAKAKAYLAVQEYPLVIKASGLALGKGAVIVQSRPEAEALIEEMMVKQSMGEAGAVVVIEEFLQGEEASIIGITDGRRIFTCRRRRTTRHCWMATRDRTPAVWARMRLRRLSRLNSKPRLKDRSLSRCSMVCAGAA